MRRLAPILAVLFMVGCGSSTQQRFDDALMDAEFATVDLRIAQQIQREAQTGDGKLIAATREYIATTRTYADALGDAEVDKRLTAKFVQLARWCAPCALMLDAERETR